MSLNFEGASLSTFRNFPKRFCHGEVDDGRGGMNEICSRPKVPDDAISGAVADTVRCYPCLNWSVASCSNFQENLNQTLM